MTEDNRLASEQFYELIKSILNKDSEPQLTCLGDVDADFQIELENWITQPEIKKWFQILKKGKHKELGLVTRLVPGNEFETVEFVNQYGMKMGFAYFPNDPRFAQVPQGFNIGNLILCEGDVMDVVSVKPAKFRPETDKKVRQKFLGIVEKLHEEGKL